ncbi:hypothetical protein GCM10009116_04950 [Brevundimonas basaltis]|uniref:Uncharacterized protein n=1 Tax=Brevundimonas basaltis TaxID=472166 RepID=A0A7W8I021_9CAUL|nr:hypothetical protein [Brevundimonas basaltis]MBB5292764.1 hypothetical protein [Brevundimonas basaltis]
MPDARPLTAPRTRRDGARRPAPKTVWEAVRADYMAGLPAHECCRRHGVTIAALRSRAARNGWRRIDQPWTPANALDPADEGVQLEQRSEGDLDRIDTGELIFVAHRRMLRCVLRGDAAGALRWGRVGKALEAEEAEMRRYLCQEEALNSARLAEAADGADWLRPTPGFLAAADADSADSAIPKFPDRAEAGKDG